MRFARAPAPAPTYFGPKSNHDAIAVPYSPMLLPGDATPPPSLNSSIPPLLFGYKKAPEPPCALPLCFPSLLVSLHQRTLALPFFGRATPPSYRPSGEPIPWPAPSSRILSAEEVFPHPMLPPRRRGPPPPPPSLLRPARSSSARSEAPLASPLSFVPSPWPRVARARATLAVVPPHRCAARTSRASPPPSIAHPCVARPS